MSDIWAEIDAAARVHADDPNARTVNQLAEAWGCCEQSARDRAKDLVAEGKLECRRVVRVFPEGKRQVRVYLPGVPNGKEGQEA